MAASDPIGCLLSPLSRLHSKNILYIAPRENLITIQLITNQTMLAYAKASAIVVGESDGEVLVLNGLEEIVKEERIIERIWHRLHHHLQ